MFLRKKWFQETSSVPAWFKGEYGLICYKTMQGCTYKGLAKDYELYIPYFWPILKINFYSRGSFQYRVCYAMYSLVPCTRSILTS